ncbi:MAG: hypothetical protein QXV17_00345 [Candidatus Micrarchaeaceae archaeon]
MLIQLSFEVLICMAIAIAIVAFLMSQASGFFLDHMQYSLASNTFCTSSALSKMLSIIGAYQAISWCV